MNSKSKKILITEGGGFIGSNLTKQLRFYGGKVDIYDLHEGNDILDYSRLRSYIRKSYDIIYHLSGFSGSAKK